MTGWECLFEPDPMWERIVFTLLVGVVTFFETLRHLKHNNAPDSGPRVGSADSVVGGAI